MTTTGAGRPRLSTRKRPGATARDEILDAAAELFTSRGITGTSTRMIAEAVGIRQASMYHHFATKDDILAELLHETVAAPVAHADRIRAHTDDPATRLYALTLFDARQLADSRWNLGALYLLPEVHTERFADFRVMRGVLMDRYEEFARDALAAIAGTNCGPGASGLPFRLVEATINARSDAAHQPTSFPLAPHTVASAALRVLGWAGDTDAVADRATALLDRIAASCPQPTD